MNKLIIIKKWKTYGSMCKCGKSNPRIENHIYIKFFNKKLYIDWTNNK